MMRIEAPQDGQTSGLAALGETERVRFLLVLTNMFRRFEVTHMKRDNGAVPMWVENAPDLSRPDLLVLPGYQDFIRLRGHIARKDSCLSWTGSTSTRASPSMARSPLSREPPLIRRVQTTTRSDS